MSSGDEALATIAQPSEGGVRRALATLLHGGILKLSERNRRFLSYVVSETLAGRANRIKAYTIGVDVFGRPADFDPAVDPIVRIEATRLRAAISTYYETVGSGDLIRIHIPPGGYAPAFERRGSINSEGATQTAGVALTREENDFYRPAVIIDAGAVSSSADSAPVEYLMSALAQCLKANDIRVFLKPAPDRAAAINAMREMYHHPKHVRAIDLRCRAEAGAWRCSWSLMDLSTGEILVARSYSVAADGEAERIAGDIAATVAPLVMSLHCASGEASFIAKAGDF